MDCASDELQVLWRKLSLCSADGSWHKGDRMDTSPKTSESGRAGVTAGSGHGGVCVGEYCGPGACELLAGRSHDPARAEGTADVAIETRSTRNIDPFHFWGLHRNIGFEMKNYILK